MRKPKRKQRKQIDRFVNKSLPMTAWEKNKYGKKAYANARMMQLATTSRRRAVMYAYSSIVLALHERTPFRMKRISTVISTALSYWQNEKQYGREDSMINTCKGYGVEVMKIFDIDPLEDVRKYNINPAQVKEFTYAVRDMRLAISSALIALHDLHGYGEKRLNRIANHAWTEYLHACTIPDKSIMDLCEDVTGIRVQLEE